MLVMPRHFALQRRTSPRGGVGGRGGGVGVGRGGHWLPGGCLSVLVPANTMRTAVQVPCKFTIVFVAMHWASNLQFFPIAASNSSGSSTPQFQVDNNC